MCLKSRIVHFKMKRAILVDSTISGKMKDLQIRYVKQLLINSNREMGEGKLEKNRGGDKCLNIRKMDENKVTKKRKRKERRGHISSEE